MSVITREEGLGDVLKALTQRVAALERGHTLERAAIQVTPSASTSRAFGKGVLILDANGRELVRLGATDTDASPAAAQSLYGVSVKDAAGLLRALFGQTSPTPTYGLRTYDNAGVKRFDAGQLDGSTYGAAAYDAGGNPIWDTTGLVAVAGIANQASFGSQTYTMTNDTAWHDVPNSSSGSFTLARTAAVLALGSITSTNASGSFISDVLYSLVIEDGSGNVLWRSQTGLANTPNGYYNITQYILQSLAAGTYQVRWQYQQALTFSNTQSVTVKALISSAIRFGA